MAQTLVQKSVLDSDGSNIPMPFHQDSVTGSNYPAIQYVPGEIGGCLTDRVLLTGATNQDSRLVVTGIHQLYGFELTSISAAIQWLKIYDKATAPTSTDTPKLTIPIAIGSTTIQQVFREYKSGLAFSLGIGYRVTDLQADSDTGAVTSGDVQVTIIYK